MLHFLFSIFYSPNGCFCHMKIALLITFMLYDVCVYIHKSLHEALLLLNATGVFSYKDRLKK